MRRLWKSWLARLSGLLKIQLICERLTVCTESQWPNSKTQLSKQSKSTMKEQLLRQSENWEIFVTITRGSLNEPKLTTRLKSGHSCHVSHSQSARVTSIHGKATLRSTKWSAAFPFLLMNSSETTSSRLALKLLNGHLNQSIWTNLCYPNQVPMCSYTSQSPGWNGRVSWKPCSKSSRLYNSSSGRWSSSLCSRHK